MNPETRSFYHRRTFTWTHIVWDSVSLKAVIIDPVLDYDPASGRTGTESAQELLDFVAEKALDVTLILETHAHADHLTAAARLKKELGCPVAIGKGICSVQETFRDVFNLGDSLATDGSQFDRLLDDGEVIPLGDLEIRVMNTPGHTNDSVTYVVGESAYIGDTMFLPSLGTARCDFPGGDASRLYESIQRILALGDDMMLYVCHDYPADGAAPTSFITVAGQRSGNIHLRNSVGRDEFIRMRTERDAQLSMPALILPSIQVNIRAGELPAAEDNGTSYLKMPLDVF
jgi:glyoxylase-like metal-dependent hydrolase (beta-lactamase superfamily II)